VCHCSTWKRRNHRGRPVHHVKQCDLAVVDDNLKDADVREVEVGG
jgi:hypothetical protein